MVLVCHMISQDYMIKGSFNESPPNAVAISIVVVEVWYYSS